MVARLRSASKAASAADAASRRRSASCSAALEEVERLCSAPAFCSRACVGQGIQGMGQSTYQCALQRHDVLVVLVPVLFAALGTLQPAPLHAVELQFGWKLPLLRPPLQPPLHGEPHGAALPVRSLMQWKQPPVGGHSDESVSKGRAGVRVRLVTRLHAEP